MNLMATENKLKILSAKPLEWIWVGWARKATLAPRHFNRLSGTTNYPGTDTSVLLHDKAYPWTQKPAAITFAKQRTLKGLKEPSSFDKTIQLSTQVKYLETTVKKGLTWDEQLYKLVNTIRK
jgi:hypothetical protein